MFQVIITLLITSFPWSFASAHLDPLKTFIESFKILLISQKNDQRKKEGRTYVNSLRPLFPPSISPPLTVLPLSGLILTLWINIFPSLIHHTKYLSQKNNGNFCIYLPYSFTFPVSLARPFPSLLPSSRVPRVLRFAFLPFPSLSNACHGGYA